MAIKYLAGERLIGTAAERAALTTQAAMPQTHYKELGKATVSGSNVDTITIDFTTAKENLMIIMYAPSMANGGTALYHRFGDVASGSGLDSGNNYAYTRGDNGSDDEQANTQSGMLLSNDHMEYGAFGITYIKNYAAHEKSIITHSVQNRNTGAGGYSSQAMPYRTETTGKWVNTSNQITIASFRAHYGSDPLPAGSQIIVLGCDDNEPNSGTNAWQEIAQSSTLTSGVLDSGTFGDYEYLWYQARCTCDTYNSQALSTKFNGTTSSDSNYSTRRNENHGTDAHHLSANGILSANPSDNNKVNFEEGYIVNKADKEKLVMKFGCGSPIEEDDIEIPNSNESTGKWAYTSDQINSIQLIDWDSGGTALVNGTIRVWGYNP